MFLWTKIESSGALKITPSEVRESLTDTNDRCRTRETRVGRSAAEMKYDRREIINLHPMSKNSG